MMPPASGPHKKPSDPATLKPAKAAARWWGGAKSPHMARLGEKNAALHTPKGTALQISATRTVDTLTVAVRDNGPGLPAGSEHTMFEKFERGTREGMTSGSGLGLSICRAIVELHGLAIAARNLPEGGAEFTVRFPVETAPQPPVGA